MTLNDKREPMQCSKCGNKPKVKGNSYCVLCKREYQRKHKLSPENLMLKSAKKRATAKGLPFDLDVSDIVIPEQCPVLAIPLFKGKGVACDNSPALDRITPNKGYVKGNVAVISTRANRIKSNATYEEIQMVADWVKAN
ncbi:MAG: hypothetical protein CMJ25_13510 [Phycisphaerae bacterium]|nr:hypothetical protein [Phycisphaerae bacterium]